MKQRKARKDSATSKKQHPIEKTALHLRNAHRERYPLIELIALYPDLAPFVKLNPYKDLSIDFFDPKAVLALNRVLLMHYYNIAWWQIPEGYLSPAIPGRADYIHNVADILASCNGGTIPTGPAITCLDIGVGANCVYPIIGNHSYGWSFIGSDVDVVAIKCASEIVMNNATLKNAVTLRLHANARAIFEGVVVPNEQVDIVICNPPFHASMKDAQLGTLQKLSHLRQEKARKADLNFGGQNRELWCEGGELQFITTMINESKTFSKSCFWFTSLVSKSSNLDRIYEALKAVGVIEMRTMPMGQGNKISRLVAWTFLTLHEQKQWAANRWNKRT